MTYPAPAHIAAHDAHKERLCEMDNLPHLTPALLMTLRGSIHQRTPGGATDLGTPYMLYLPADACFLLCCDGRPQARHMDPRVLAKLMLCERAERGFIGRTLSATEPCDVALLNPDERLAWASARRAERLNIAAQETASLARTHRRASALDVSKISLDDL